MPLIATALAATLAVSTSVSPVCSWNRPGVDPYRGDAAAALAHYQDIPAAQRKILLDKIDSRKPDDKVAIRRDAISGTWQYDAAIRDMHFGKGRMCGSVDRSQWTAARSEPAAVYCADQHCIVVPKICGNVSRISRVFPARPEQPTTVEVTLPPPQPWNPAHHPLDWATGTELGLSDVPDDGGDEGSEVDQPGEPRLLAYDGNPPLWGWDEDHPVQAVPEASTWAMLLAGVGIVAAWGRRQARRAAPDA